MSKEFQKRTTVIIDDDPWGVFDRHEPGDSTGSATKHRPGGMQKPVIYKGRPDIDNGTVSRVQERDRDFERIRRLRQRTGRASIVISDQELDDEGNPWGNPIVTRGVVERVKRAPSDSESDETGTLEIEYITESES